MWFGYSRNFFDMARLHYTGGWLFFIGILVVALAAYLVIRSSKRSASFTASEVLLKERLIKGEISAEEYEKLLGLIKK
ncbi:MAG: hypothetical protein JXN65_10810 [Clostridia bacterium]|nr:hypothetical protein [Clostridia bacterium]